MLPLRLESPEPREAIPDGMALTLCVYVVSLNSALSVWCLDRAPTEPDARACAMSSVQAQARQARQTRDHRELSSAGYNSESRLFPREKIKKV